MFSLFLTTSLAYQLFEDVGSTAEVMGTILADLGAHPLGAHPLGAHPLTSEHQCNEKDMQMAKDLESDMKKCMANGNITGLSDCLEKDGFSHGCVGCVAKLVECSLKNCADSCMKDSKGAECKKCTTDHCMDPFSQCSGFPKIDPNGKCADEKDLKFLGDMQKQMMKCAWTLVVKGGTTLAQCLHNNGCSVPCSGCLDTVVHCTMDKCGGKCKNPKDPDCQKCTKKFCMKDFGTCSGIHMPDAAHDFLEAILA